MALIGPSETRISTIIRWAVYCLIVAGTAIYLWSTNPAGFWSYAEFCALSIGGIVAIHSLIVEPLQREIRSLRLELESIERHFDRRFDVLHGRIDRID